MFIVLVIHLLVFSEAVYRLAYNKRKNEQGHGKGWEQSSSTSSTRNIQMDEKESQVEVMYYFQHAEVPLKMTKTKFMGFL